MLIFCMLFRTPTMAHANVIELILTSLYQIVAWPFSTGMNGNYRSKN